MWCDNCVHCRCHLTSGKKLTILDQMELNAMRKFLNLTVTCHKILFLMYVNSNYFSPSRIVLAEGPLAEMYGYCKNWKAYEDLDCTGNNKRFWDDGVKESLQDIVTLRQAVLLKMQMQEGTAETSDKDETENSDQNAPENSDNAEPENIDKDEPEDSDKENCAKDETENSDKENSDK